MRSIWKGTITFGMVSIPTKLHSATEDVKAELHLYHHKCGSRISMPKFCPICEVKLEPDQIVKGYQAGDTYVPLTEQDFQSLPLRSVKTVEVVEFVKPEQIDLRCYNKPYFLAADTGGNKAYRLLLMAMAETHLVGVAKFTYREREHLAIISPYSGVLMLHTIRYANELRPYDELKPEQRAFGDEISNREMGLAATLVKSMAAETFDLAKYHNDYNEALERLIEAKLAGEALPVMDEVKATISDVEEALKASLAALA